jgi:hypothetical protein
MIKIIKLILIYESGAKYKEKIDSWRPVKASHGRPRRLNPPELMVSMVLVPKKRTPLRKNRIGARRNVFS